MSYYADPTANKALGNLNRELSKIEKRMNRLWALSIEGKIPPEELTKVVMQYKGIYRHVAINTLNAKKSQANQPPESSGG